MTGGFDPLLLLLAVLIAALVFFGVDLAVGAVRLLRRRRRRP